MWSHREDTPEFVNATTTLIFGVWCAAFGVVPWSSRGALPGEISWEPTLLETSGTAQIASLFSNTFLHI